MANRERHTLGWNGMASRQAEITLERTVAYFRPKITPAFSLLYGGQRCQNATIPQLCSQLKGLAERFGRSSRGISVRGVDIGQGGIERAVPKMLANQKGVRALLDH